MIKSKYGKREAILPSCDIYGDKKMKTKILYEDRDIIVCHKPSGIAVQSAGVGSMDMVSELKKHIRQSAGVDSSTGRTNVKEPYLGVVHRLDQPVEGVIVFARTRKAAAELSKQAASPADMAHAVQTGKASDRIMKKIYHAEVYGHLPETSGELQNDLVKDAKTNTSHVVSMPESVRAGQAPDSRNRKAGEEKNPEAPKWSYLTYQVLERRDETDLLEILLFTGRHHQIRVQFSYAGYPLVGDMKYASAESAEYNQRKNIRSISLKAVRLEFTHPGSGKRMVFSIRDSC